MRQFQVVIPNGRRVSRRMGCLIFIVSACLLSINYLHTIAIRSFTTVGNFMEGGYPSSSAIKKDDMSSFYGYLPVQILRAQEQTQSSLTTLTTSSLSSSSSSSSSSSDRPALTSITSAKRNTKHSRWAYAFLMAGVNAKQLGYRGILYNVLVSAELLKNSKADVVLMVQMAQNSASNRLLPMEEKWLHSMNVTIKYLDLPKHGVLNFYTVQLEKFRILEWTEYSRVIFMDGDVMPFCPLDYLFELSDREEDPLLQQNLIMAWSIEPAHGGFFMLSPKRGDFETIQAIVEKREQQVYETGIMFDGEYGWGHKIEPRGWRAALRTKLNTALWDWHGDFIDQGLLYYWTKYFKMDVSIVVNDEVENWSSIPIPQTNTSTSINNAKNHSHSTNQSPLSNNNTQQKRQINLDQILSHPFDSYDTCVKNMNFPRPRRFSQTRGEQRYAPYRDFVHFTGDHKPWLGNTMKKLDLDAILSRVRNEEDGENLDGLGSPEELWYYTFWKVHQRLDMGKSTTNALQHVLKVATNQTTTNSSSTKHHHSANLVNVDIRNLNIPNSLYGGYPTYNQMKDAMKARTGLSTDHIEGWTEIEKRKKALRKQRLTKRNFR